MCITNHLLRTPIMYKHEGTFCTQVSLLAKLPRTAQTAVLHAHKYADYDPGELIIKEGVRMLLSIMFWVNAYSSYSVRSCMRGFPIYK